MYNYHKFTTMKKTYIIPAMDVTLVVAEEMIAGSITGVGGDSGIEIGDGETPGEADVKGNNYNVWDEDWSR